MTSETITRRVAAKLIGVHEDTLSRLLNDVLAPAVVGRGGRGGALQLSRPAIEVYVALQKETRPLDPQHERSRRDAAAADLSELRLAVEKGEYLAADDVLQTWTAEIAAVRARLLAWASLLADRLGVPAKVIEDAVHEVLTELSDPDRDGLGEEAKPEPQRKKAAKKKATNKKRPRGRNKRKSK